MVIMPGEHDIDPRIFHCIKREFLAADCALDLPAHFEGKKRVVSHQDPHRVPRASRENIANEFHLILVDPAVLECKRAGSVDPQNRDAGELDERAKRLINEAAIASERREESTQHIVERHVVIAWHS